MADDWISVNDAARIAGYHPDYIRKRINNRRIKAKKVITVWLVSRKSLDAYLREQSERGEKRGRKPLT